MSKITIDSQCSSGIDAGFNRMFEYETRGISSTCSQMQAWKTSFVRFWDTQLLTIHVREQRED